MMHIIASLTLSTITFIETATIPSESSSMRDSFMAEAFVAASSWPFVDAVHRSASAPRRCR